MHIVSDYSDQMPNFSTFTLNFLGTKKKKNSFPFLVDFLKCQDVLVENVFAGHAGLKNDS